MLYTKKDTARYCTNELELPFRSPFRRDYARLLHSPAFRRLQGKTQLYPGDESDFFRNRLTHSLEVAQIAKGIAEKLNYDSSYLQSNPLDTNLVEFAALAHDLGHPPFGHNGEKALDVCMREWGGFEGNAQTLRLLAVVEKKATDNGALIGIDPNTGADHRLGLDLTYRSLASVLKYDCKIPKKRQADSSLVKGYYASESKLVEQIKSHVAPKIGAKKRRFKTIECQIMDLADDIAYSTYDLEDGLKGGFVDPLYLLSALRENNELLRRVSEKVRDVCPEIELTDVVEALAKVFDMNIRGRPNSLESSDDWLLEAYAGSRLLTTNGYARIALTSELINKFISGVGVVIDNDFPALSEITVEKNVRLQIEVLKHLNYEITIMSPRLQLVEYRGFDIVKGIFDALVNDGGHLLLPQDYRDYFESLTKDGDRRRLVCDFVAGMTDRYAVEFYSRLKHGDQSIFKPF